MSSHKDRIWQAVGHCEGILITIDIFTTNNQQMSPEIKAFIGSVKESVELIKGVLIADCVKRRMSRSAQVTHVEVFCVNGDWFYRAISGDNVICSDMLVGAENENDAVFLVSQLYVGADVQLK